MTAMPAQALRRARVAVAAAFFVNGAAFAGWVPRIPDAAARLGLDPPALGLALAGTGVGALLGSVLAAPLIASRGSRLVTVRAGTALCAAVVLPALAGSWLALTGALLLVGVADAVMDVAMNANAVAVDIGPGAHLATAAAVLLVALWACSPHLLRADGGAAPVAGRAGLPRPTPALGALGAVALCAAVIEGAAADWGALHLAAQEGAPPGGFAFAAFCAAMIAGRVVGDREVEAVGAATTARGGAAMAAGH